MESLSYSEQGKSPLERGLLRHQQKDYAGAVIAFTQAVDTSTGHLLLNALDYRARAYQKLGALQSALRDAREAIKLKPTLAKGYIRCGSILQKEGNIALALKIYERGLAKVKIGTPQRQDLQALFTKLKHDENPGVTRDPLQFLPTELALMVSHHLEMRDRIICLAVSKAWKRMLESSPGLWTTFDTTYARKPIPLKSLQLHAKRSQYTVNLAIVTTRAGIDSTKLRYLTKSCKNLQEIHISGSGLVGGGLAGAISLAQNIKRVSVSRATEISCQTAISVLASCHRSLVDAIFLNVTGSYTGWELPAIESLRSIQIRGAKGNNNSMAVTFLVPLILMSPNATAITINDVRMDIASPFLDLSPWMKLERLDLRNTQLITFPPLPPTLKHVIVSDNLGMFLESSAFLPPNDLNELPLLETFACDGTKITAEALELLTRPSIKRGNLKTLLVGNRTLTSPSIPMRGEFPASDTVEELSLSRMILGDKEAMEVVNLYPKIQILDMSVTQITGVAVKAFVNHGVKWLKLNECASVSPDAVEWARSKGIDVDFKFPSRSTREARRFADRA